MADNAPEKFGLIQVEEDLTTFPISDPEMGFETWSPDDFIWNEKDDVPPEFSEAGVFSSLRQVYVGYDPLNRDRFEISVYVGTIFPERQLLGTGYAQLLAARWGKLKFGVMPRSNDFGELLGGDDSSGIRIINRISVIRRGTDVLILRSKFHADHFATYADAIARFHGSVSFLEPRSEDPVVGAFKAGSLAIGGSAPFTFEMPGNWAELNQGGALDPSMVATLWSDVDDPNGNSGVMIVAVAPPKQPDPGKSLAAPDPQDMNNLAATLAGAAIQNLLPGQDYGLTPKNKASFPEFDDITLSQAVYYFAVELSESEHPMRATVLMSMGLDGTTLGSVVLSPPGLDLYLLGTSYHGELVTSLQIDAQDAYWRAQAQ